MKAKKEQEYNPKKAYPRLKHKIWRDLMRPGPIRYLTKEEIEREYGPPPHYFPSH